MPNPVYRKHSLLPLAKQLRHNMTDQERKLWYTFLKDYPARIYKQRIIGHYIADFYCAAANLVIELDGSQHYEADSLEYDKQREDYMSQRGLHTLRFTNAQIDQQFDSVCSEIDRVIRECVRQ